MSTATLERLPNTVTRCHEEIRRLREVAKEPDDSSVRVEELEAELAELKQERDDLKDSLASAGREAEELMEQVETLEEHQYPDVLTAIDAFLDECERVGPMRFDVPQTDGANRAIVALHDAAGRQP